MTEKKELLSKPVWTFRDIMNYFGCSQKKAFDIKNKAIEKGGGVSYGKHYVQSDCVLSLFGTSRQKELKVLVDEEKVH